MYETNSKCKHFKQVTHICSYQIKKTCSQIEIEMYQMTPDKMHTWITFQPDLNSHKSFKFFMFQHLSCAWLYKGFNQSQRQMFPSGQNTTVSN